jgi:hypothetical protein
MATSGYKSISRLDHPKKRTHGWYVRVVFQGEIHAHFFSDEGELCSHTVTSGLL